MLSLLVDSDLHIYNKFRPVISISTTTAIFQRVVIFEEYEYQMDFGWDGELPESKDFEEETTWQVGFEYVLSRNFSLMGSYDNRFGAGGGL